MNLPKSKTMKELYKTSILDITPEKVTAAQKHLDHEADEAQKKGFDRIHGAIMKNWRRT